MKYFLKKLGALIATLLVISFLAFIAFQLIGNPIASMLGTNATPEAIETLTHELGFDRPVLVRYFEWLINFLKGDFGISYSYHLPVNSMVMPKLGVTVILTLIAFGITVAVSIPLGIIAAKKENGILDRSLLVIDQVVMSIPPFFIGILLTCLFGLVLRVFTPGLFVPLNEDAGRFFSYMIFPALSIAIPRIAMTIKMLRSSILSEMQKDYITTAYARGANRKRALYEHALKNAIIPVISFLAVSLSEMLASCIVIEQIFSVPGIGRLLVSSIGTRDFTVVLAIVMILATWVVVVNFIADLIYQLIDPRIRLN